MREERRQEKQIVNLQLAEVQEPRHSVKEECGPSINIEEATINIGGLRSGP